MKTKTRLCTTAAARLGMLISMLFPAYLFALPRTPGDQVGLFWLDVTNPDPIHVTFTFKVANMSGVLSPGVAAPFLDTSGYVFMYRPEFTIPSPTPESKPATILPASLGGLFATPHAINAGDFDHTLLTQTSINPDHIASLIGVLNADLSTRAALLNQFSAEQQEAMWAVLKGLYPAPLDWESGLTKLLNIWLPGSEAIVMLIDVGITYGAIQNTLTSLAVLQPQINHLADLTEEQALEVWLPYGDARLAGTIPENPDPGILSFIGLGPKGSIPTGGSSPILVVPDEFSTLAMIVAAGAILGAAAIAPGLTTQIPRRVVLNRRRS